MAAVARDSDEARGDGVSLRFGGEVVVMARGCIGEEDMDLEGGRELRSGGAIQQQGTMKNYSVGVRIWRVSGHGRTQGFEYLRSGGGCAQWRRKKGR